MSQENENTPSIVHNDSESSCESFARADLFKEIVRPPVPGDQLAYEVCFDKPIFSIVDGYLSVVPKCYEYNLCNSVSLLDGDTLTITITVPKQILGCHNGYEFPANVPLVNLLGSLKLEADNANVTILLTPTNPRQLITVTDDIGWITFTLSFVADRDYDNLCSLCYSISFQSIKLVTLYSKCKCNKNDKCSSCKKGRGCRRPYESITLESETSLSILAVVPTTAAPTTTVSL